MKIKVISIVFLAFVSFGFSNCGNASEGVLIDQPWDISKENNTLEQTFTVSAYNFYTLYIRPIPIKRKNYISNEVWEPLRRKQVKQLEELFGRGAEMYNTKTHEYVQTRTDEETKRAWHLLDTGEIVWKYRYPGTIIPVYFKIDKLDKNQVANTVIEKS